MADLQSPFKQQSPLQSPFKKTEDTERMSSPFSKTGEKQQHPVETFGEHALASIPASATTVMGAKLGLRVPGGVFAKTVGSLVGAIAGGIAGSMATHGLLPDSINKHLEEGEKQNPISAFTGDIASFGSVSKVGLPATKKVAAVLAAAGGGLETGRELAQGEKLDPTKIAISAITTPLFGGEHTKLGRIVTGDIKMPVNTQTPEELTAELTKRRDWEPPKEYNGIPIKEGKTTTGAAGSFSRDKNEIILDREMINHMYEANLETKKGKLQEMFKSPQEFSQFVLAHEVEHTNYSLEEFKTDHNANVDPTDIPLSEGELATEYERSINNRAWERLQSEGFQKGRVDVGIPDRWKTADDYRDNMHLLNSLPQADKIALNALMMKAKDEGMTPELMEEFRKFEEGQGGEGKHPLYDKFIKPISEANKDGLKYLMDEGVISKEDMQESAAPRQFKAMDEESLKALEGDKTLWEKAKAAMEEFTGDRGDFNPAVDRVRSSGQKRAIYALESNAGGRTIVQFTKGGDLIEWTRGKVRNLGPVEGEFKAGDDIANGVLKQASIDEIEAHSPYRYEKDYQAVLYKKYLETREMIRAHEAIKSMKESPEFKKISHKIDSGSAIPDGFSRPRFLDRFGNALDGYAFENRVSEILSDFAQVRKSNMITAVSGVLVQNMMLNPIPHMFNEVMHLYNARGLTGWVTPAGIQRFAKNGTKAIRSVLTQDKAYTDIIKAGGSMMAPGTRENALRDSLYKKGVDEFSKTPEFKELAKSFALTPVKMYKALSKASSKAMWISRDIMYMQYVTELSEHKGLSTEEAVKEAERHMPNYRLPERVGQGVLGADLSRGLSTVLNNPSVSVFSRYHYGMMKSMIETMKDVGQIRKGKAGLEQFKDGLDTLAAITVALSVLYPLMDMVAQELTGNPKAEQRRAGPYHFMNAVSEVANGTKEPQAVLSSVFTFNPALLAVAQLGVDRQLYNGQPIYHPTDSAEQIASDVGSYAAKQLPSVSTGIRAGGETGGGLEQIAAAQIDIKSPTEKATQRIDKIRHRDIRASEIREQKRKLREMLGR
jgi:hypothetical protein